ncbi:hypothetical protein SAY87_011709 [Trapa incisa]|uniref:Transmembrane protein n=1 Tax=Trapa incisa TaxID=236973 RepID=A0AAN7GSB5_9MYRT|nr:hypothetical protein SAY87_011709 [Trapa incisa]
MEETFGCQSDGSVKPISSEWALPSPRLRPPFSSALVSAMAEEEYSAAPEDISSAKAVLLGALAPGVNGPTWNTLKAAFFMLGLVLIVMMAIAFSSSDSWLTFHVSFLVLIAVTLFLLLSW